MILNIGCGGTAPYHDFTEYGDIRLDLVKAPNVNMVADGCRLPFRDESINTVFASHMMEHVLCPYLLLKEIHRVLKPGGEARITVPYLFDNIPQHIYSWNEATLGNLLRRVFDEVDVRRSDRRLWPFNRGKRFYEFMQRAFRVPAEYQGICRKRVSNGINQAENLT